MFPLLLRIMLVLRMKIRIGYFLVGCVIGLLLLVQWVSSFPDGKLIITVCNVGQGDALYVRFPDGRDMLVDGGPGEKVLECLGSVMPIVDRSIDLVVLTHPESDHMSGIVSVLERYTVGTILRSDIGKETKGYSSFLDALQQSKTQQKYIVAGDSVAIGAVRIQAVWPTTEELAILHRAQEKERAPVVAGVFTGMEQGAVVDESGSVSVAQSEVNVNDASVVFQLSYGAFDMLFTGDADDRVQPMFLPQEPADGVFEVIKVPHHGSKKAFDDAWFERVSAYMSHGTCRQCSEVKKEEQQPLIDPCCSIAVISVGKNTYGHPAPELLNRLHNAGFGVLRSDVNGRITITADTEGWNVKTEQ